MKLYAHLEAENITIILHTSPNENEQSICNKIADQLNEKYQLNLKVEEISLYSDNEGTKPIVAKNLENTSDIFVLRKSASITVGTVWNLNNSSSNLQLKTKKMMR